MSPLVAIVPVVIASLDIVLVVPVEPNVNIPEADILYSADLRAPDEAIVVTSLVSISAAVNAKLDPLSPKPAKFVVSNTTV